MTRLGTTIFPLWYGGVYYITKTTFLWNASPYRLPFLYDDYHLGTTILPLWVGGVYYMTKTTIVERLGEYFNNLWSKIN